MRAERSQSGHARASVSMAAIGGAQLLYKVLTHKTAYEITLGVIGSLVLIAIAWGMEQTRWADNSGAVFTALGIGVLAMWLLLVLV